MIKVGTFITTHFTSNRGNYRHGKNFTERYGRNGFY